MDCHLQGEISGADAPGFVPLVALQRVDESYLSDIETADRTGEHQKESKRNILCKTCGKAITSDDDGIVMNGSHEHTFMNPRGLVFRIGCFAGAVNCHIMGAPTSEFTWFPGFVWCYVVCAGCLSHLGWHYQSGENGFFGLILDQLVRQ